MSAAEARHLIGKTFGRTWKRDAPKAFGVHRTTVDRWTQGATIGSAERAMIRGICGEYALANRPPPAREGLIAARQVLVAEDERLIATFVELTLDDLGVVPLCALTLDRALEMAETPELDAALLDVRMDRGQRIWPVARRLIQRKVPIILTSGLDARSEMPGGFPRLEMLLKPFGPADIERELAKLLVASAVES